MDDWKADVRRFLREDLGPGDITSRAVVPKVAARAWVRAEAPCTVAGLREAVEVFRALSCRARGTVRDGSSVRKGTVVLLVTGPARGILAGERLALNFLMRMSGVATATRRVVKRARAVNPDVQIAATRKTVPGFRVFDKRAVVLGGGVPHRMGLYDAVLVKENHLKFRTIEDAVRLAKRSRRKVEVEAETTSEAVRAASAGAKIVMLDNFAPDEARRAFRRLKKEHPRVQVEVSGGIDEGNVSRYARWADIISLGAITHSAKAAGFSLDLEPTR